MLSRCDCTLWLYCAVVIMFIVAIVVTLLLVIVVGCTVLVFALAGVAVVTHFFCYKFCNSKHVSFKLCVCNIVSLLEGCA